MKITAERLRVLVRYDPETGIFTRIATSRADHLGLRAGRLKNGYSAFSVDGKTFFAHRLAWLYVYGEWPKHQIDHINRDRTDNRIANLRDVTPADNAANAPASRASKTGLRGVYWRSGTRRRPYRAQICRNGKTRSLGHFATPEAAYAAYLAAAAELHRRPHQ